VKYIQVKRIIGKKMWGVDYPSLVGMEADVNASLWPIVRWGRVLSGLKLLEMSRICHQREDTFLSNK